MLTDEYRYKILKVIEDRPEISQRELAQTLGISLGKVNFCLNALIEVGLIKAANFKNNRNKLSYMYYLTPTGMEEKATVTLRFFNAKMKEYQLLQQEIAQLKLDVELQHHLT